MKTPKTTKAAIAALEDIKARDITVLDVRSLTSLYDTLIVATAESTRQTRALANHVREKVSEAQGRVVGTEGEASGEWVLVDCGDFVVHIMIPAARTYYNLEELWTPPTPVRPPKAEKPAKAATRAVSENAGSAKATGAATRKPGATRTSSKSTSAPTSSGRKVAAKKSALAAISKPTEAAAPVEKTVRKKPAAAKNATAEKTPTVKRTKDLAAKPDSKVTVKVATKVATKSALKTKSTAATKNATKPIAPDPIAKPATRRRLKTPT